MKILILSPSIFPDAGGLQRYTYNLATSLSEDHHNVRVIVLNRPKYFLNPAERIEYIAVDNFSSVPPRVLLQIWQKFYLFQFLWAQLNEFEPERVICTWWDPFGYIIGPLVRLKKISYILVGHGQEITQIATTGLGAIIKKFSRKVAFICANQVVAVSSFTAHALQRIVTAKKIKIVPNGLTTQYIKESSLGYGPPYDKGDTFHILQVGRLVKRKGHLLILDAISKMIQSYHLNIRYIIIGSGPYLEDIKMRIKELGLDKHVVLTGYVSDEDIHKYYCLSDLVVMLSQHPDSPGDVEGFGIVFLEAYAHKKPVIGTDFGGISDAIVDGKTGYIIPLDKLETLIPTIQKFIDDRQLAVEMGRNGYSFLHDRWNWSNLCKEFIHNEEMSDALRANSEPHC